MGTRTPSEPLNSFLIVINDLTYSFLSPFLTTPMEMVALITSRICLMIYLIDITHIDHTCDKVGQN